jgi:hypothetical protein
MLSHSFKHALGGVWLIASVIVAGAQEAPNRGAFANLPVKTDGSGAERSEPTAAPDIRAVLADPSIRDFIGLAENSYDFTNPHAVPGFAPLPPSSNKMASGR